MWEFEKMKKIWQIFGNFSKYFLGRLTYENFSQKNRGNVKKVKNEDVKMEVQNCGELEIFEERAQTVLVFEKEEG